MTTEKTRGNHFKMDAVLILVLMPLSAGMELLGGYAADESGYRVKLVSPVLGSEDFDETYVMAFIVSSKSSPLTGSESGYVLNGNIHSGGVGGAYTESGYSMFLAPEQAFTSYQDEVTAYDALATTTSTTSTTTTTTTSTTTTSTTSTTTVSGATTTSTTTTSTTTSTSTSSTTSTSTVAPPPILVNEFLPHPSGSQQEWIELYNNGTEEARVGGLQLDDSEGGSNPYTLPSITIPSKNFTVLYKNQTNLTLDDLGDTIRLLSIYGTVIDSYTYYYSLRGLSIGRETDGGADWTTFELPTPGYTNAGLNDTNPPSVSLDEPGNNAVDTDGNVFLKYTPTDLSLISNCVLYSNVSGSWQITQIDTTVIVNIQNSFGLFGLSNGTYLWNVQCTDQTSLSASAPLSRLFTVNKTADIVYNTFVNASVNQSTNVTSNETKTTLIINVTENMTNVSIVITSYQNDTKIANLSVSNIGRYVSVESNTELSESVSNVIIRIYYTDEELLAAGVTEDELSIYWFDSNTSQWVELDPATLSWVHATGVNAAENYIWADVEHFSEYAVAATGVAQQQIPLTSGWNLVSLPLNI